MKKLQILIIDDSAGDAVLLTHFIRNKGFDVATRRVDTAPDVRTALDSTDWDIVLCDMRMPKLDPQEALDIATELAPATPFVVMSGIASGELMMEPVRAGAFDFFQKDDLTRIIAIIERALHEKRSREQSRTVQTMLDESEARFRSLVETLPDGIIVYDEDGHTVFANQSMCRLMKAERREDLIGRHFSTFMHPDSRPGVARIFDQVIGTGEAIRATEHVRVALDGTQLAAEASATRVQWLGHPALLAVVRDVSARHNALVQVKRSEARAKAILWNVAEGVVILDGVGKVQTFNRAAEAMFGYTAEEVVGKSIEFLMPQGIVAEDQPFLKERFATGLGQGELEFTARRKDHTVFTAEATISETIVDDDALIIVILRDISERKASEHALRQSETRFRLAFETAPYGMALRGLDGRVIHANRALCAMVGYGRDEIHGLAFSAVVHPDDLEENERLAQKILEDRIPSCQSEKRYLRKDGGTVWVIQSTALVRDEDGTPQHFISQSVDISALKRAEEEKLRLEDQLRQSQKMEALGTLSGGIAHEFNNMLLPICGLIELSLNDVRDNPDVRENLETALENANRATALVDKILKFSRTDSCDMAQEKVSVAVEDAIALLNITMPATVQISASLEDVGEAMIDRSQITQVVLNLGINAAHAIGDHVGRIEFGLAEAQLSGRLSATTGHLSPGRYAKLSIADTGCGMDEATVARIFEPFFTTKSVGQGTGMGLAFVHGVVQTHGGVINVKSRPGEGTTFDLYFSLNQEATAAAA